MLKYSHIDVTFKLPGSLERRLLLIFVNTFLKLSPNPTLFDMGILPKSQGESDQTKSSVKIKYKTLYMQDNN